MSIGQSFAPKSDSERKEIGDLGFWSLSSSKRGNGVDELRDENVALFWQSDGPQPHFISICFEKKTRINEVWIYLDFKSDESYTPNKLSLKIDNSFGELIEVKVVDFEEPIGWFKMELEQRNDKGDIIK